MSAILVYLKEDTPSHILSQLTQFGVRVQELSTSGGGYRTVLGEGGARDGCAWVRGQVRGGKAQFEVGIPLSNVVAIVKDPPSEGETPGASVAHTRGETSPREKPP